MIQWEKLQLETHGDVQYILLERMPQIFGRRTRELHGHCEMQFLFVYLDSVRITLYVRQCCRIWSIGKSCTLKRLNFTHQESYRITRTLSVDVEKPPTMELLWATMLKEPMPDILVSIALGGRATMLEDMLKKWPEQVSDTAMESLMPMFLLLLLLFISCCRWTSSTTTQPCYMRQQVKGEWIASEYCWSTRQTSRLQWVTSDSLSKVYYNNYDGFCVQDEYGRSPLHKAARL